MNINEILEVFKKGANTPRDDSSEYQKGRSDGKSQAYAHAWTELKNLNIPDVMKSFVCSNEEVGGVRCESQCLGCDGFERSKQTDVL